MSSLSSCKSNDAKIMKEKDLFLILTNRFSQIFISSLMVKVIKFDKVQKKFHIQSSAKFSTFKVKINFRKISKFKISQKYSIFNVEKKTENFYTQHSKVQKDLLNLGFKKKVSHSRLKRSCTI